MKKCKGIKNEFCIMKDYKMDYILDPWVKCKIAFNN